jgi:serpin B
MEDVVMRLPGWGRAQRLGVAVALVGFAGAGLVGCGHTQAGHRAVTQVLTGHEEPLPPSGVPAQQIGTDAAAFGLALFSRLCAQQPTANLLLSPASAAQALGMLYAGSAGPTAASVGQLLRLPAWTPALVTGLHNQTAALARVPQLAVSNHIFEQTGLAPAARVLDDLRTAFDTDLRQVDFADEPATTNAINAVVAHDTRGLIPTLFASPLSASTRTVLTNAIYLHARWQHPFPAASPAPFHTAVGGTVSAPQMDSVDPTAAYHSAGGWQSAILPYTGGDLVAVAILPPASATGCDVPTAGDLAALTATRAGQTAKVLLPKLHLSQSWPQLQDTLTAMGLPLSGNYSGLGTGDSQISQVVQKATMDVNQMGTTAAAATGIAIGSSAIAGNIVTINFDRPFLLILEDTATRTPLFLARVADPDQA